MRPRVLIVLAALACSSCGNSDRASNPPAPAAYNADSLYTPRADREAEEAALWLSGEHFAPADLYQTIHDDLAAIRTGYLDSIPSLAVTFTPWWITSQVAVKFTDDARDRFLAREPNDVDSLNVVFHATHLDTFRLKGTSYWTLIDFAGRQHPERLGEAYEAQDDVVWGEPNGWIGDWSNVYPWRKGDGMTYLFRHGSGDCPAGCIDNIFWYFRRANGVTEYVGTFDWWADPEPDWWDEAKVAYYTFRGFPTDR